MKDGGSWKILLVDDDDNGRDAMAEWLRREGFDVIAVSDTNAAMGRLYDRVGVVVTDLKMPRISGMELLRMARQQAPHVAVILVTGHATVDSAVSALREGAFDYLTKPVNPHELAHRIRQALEKQAMATEIAMLHSQRKTHPGFEGFVGESPVMKDVFEKTLLVADTKSTVLIIGESGTGKELVAQALHHNSNRKHMPFVPINCAAIPETLVESELFGHERGAFTGANEKKAGLFQAADRGTLFIDEIGELQLNLQSKILRAIETRRVMPVGSHQEVEVDVRLVTATNRDLAQEVVDKKFRDDLYYRLRVVEIRLPPLRERREDIPLLVTFFLEQIARENDREMSEITQDCLGALMAYNWPGNVRELRNTLEGVVVLSKFGRIDVDQLPDYIGGRGAARAVIRSGMTMAEIEREAIRRALEETDGHRGNAAKMLDISVRTLQRKIKEYNLADGANPSS